MKNDPQYIQIESTRYYNNAQRSPVIKLEGDWLTSLGFEANHMIKVNAERFKIEIRATYNKSNFMDLTGAPYDHSHERELIDTQRLNASNWLNKCSEECQGLKAFMNDQTTYSLKKTMFDLVHVLHENNLLRTGADNDSK
jgi:hypothetical protein